MRVIGVGGAWIDRKCRRFFVVSEIIALVPRFNNGRKRGEKRVREGGRKEEQRRREGEQKGRGVQRERENARVL